MHPPSTPSPGHIRRLALVLMTAAAVFQQSLLSQVPSPGRVQQAPPSAPPFEVSVPQSGSGSGRKPLGITPYSIGQPTDEEQLYLEYLNRMRSNPAAEGQRMAATTDPDVLSSYEFFGVDLALMQSEFATNPPVPPMAMNAQLLAAARWHSGDMFTNQYQGHFQTNSSIVMDPGARIATNGYKASTYGENVYSYAYSVLYGHAGFAVDWGPGSGGMQTPAGHRQNMLSASYREVGIGVVDGVNGTVGPQLVTQDFGTQTGSSAFISGVVYFDLNGNGFYDIGEGIGGVKVNTPGSAYFAVTADSGGYALPVTSNATYNLTFTASSLSNQAPARVSNLQNTKLDYSPAYSPPVISGPNPAVLGQSNLYTFTPIPAASAYQLQQAQLFPYDLGEGAENGSGNVNIASSPGYSVVSTDRAASGSHSFNLVHASAVDQSLTLSPSLLVSAGSQLSFAKYLGYGFSNEVAEAQVSLDGGQKWQTVWSQPGNDGNTSVDSAFVAEIVPLGAYAGQILQVRFVYAYNNGFYYSQGSDIGVYFDDIAVSNAQQLGGATTNSLAAGLSFYFTPATSSDYLLAVRAQNNSRLLPWGPASVVAVNASTALPGIVILGAPIISGAQVQVDFSVTNFRPGMTFQLQRASDLTGSWSQDASASLQTVVPNSQFRFTTSLGGGPMTFFRIQGN